MQMKSVTGAKTKSANIKTRTAEEFDQVADSGQDMSDFLDWDKAIRGVWRSACAFAVRTQKARERKSLFISLLWKILYGVLRRIRNLFLK
jgi:hypothetical protein